MKLYTDHTSGIEAMNHCGSERQPFVFLVDYERKNIVISSDLSTACGLHFDINGVTNSHNSNKEIGSYFFEKYPIELSAYKRGFDIVQRGIQRGDSFLLNLAYPTKIVTDLTLSQIYQHTTAKYKILLEDKFVCYSPEIFVKIDNGRISSYPMKGTIDASTSNAQEILLEDSKEIAEHYTIVDLIRNDLSRVAKNVTVDRFRYIDKLITQDKNLLQVSSEISGTLPEDYHTKIGDILFQLLPAGSISGAPKKKTLEIIQRAEGIERGYYTGICGYFDGYNLDSGVMIRFIRQHGEELTYMSGCGITAMSKVDEEYREMIDKVYLPLALSENNAKLDRSYEC